MNSIIPQVKLFVKRSGLQCWWRSFKGHEYPFQHHNLNNILVKSVDTDFWGDEHGGVGKRDLTLVICYDCHRFWFKEDVWS